MRLLRNFIKGGEKYLNVYLLDSNAFITPYRSYYMFRFTKNFWNTLERLLKEGRIIVLSVVYNEIIKNTDELAHWFKNFKFQPLRTDDNPDILERYGTVLEYVKQCGFYKNSAYVTWAQESTADPWLIAAAMHFKCPIATLEASAGALHKNQPSKSAKIPDVAKHFGVSCQSLFDFMAELNIKL